MMSTVTEGLGTRRLSPEQQAMRSLQRKETLKKVAITAGIILAGIAIGAAVGTGIAAAVLFTGGLALLPPVIATSIAAFPTLGTLGIAGGAGAVIGVGIASVIAFVRNTRAASGEPGAPQGPGADDPPPPGVRIEALPELATDLPLPGSPVEPRRPLELVPPVRVEEVLGDDVSHHSLPPVGSPTTRPSGVAGFVPPVLEPLTGIPAAAVPAAARQRRTQAEITAHLGQPTRRDRAGTPQPISTVPQANRPRSASVVGEPWEEGADRGEMREWIHHEWHLPAVEERDDASAPAPSRAPAPKPAGILTRISNWFYTNKS